MGYSSGFLNKRILVQNRKEAQAGKFGIDSTGIEWENTTCVWASVDWQKGKSESQRKAMPKNAQTTTQLHSSHMLAK